MTHPKALLFDKDGTLIDFEKSWSKGLVRLLDGLFPDDVALQTKMGAACGFNLETQMFAGGSVFVNGTTADMIQVWQGIMPDLDVENIYQLGQDIFQDLDPHPICDLPAFLTQQKDNGFLLGVITNASEASTLVQLEKMKILHMFDLVLGCDSGFVAKPAPDTILGFCTKFDIHPSDAVMIGDSTHDLHAGRAANVGYNIGVLSGPADRASLQDHADIILNDITEINPALFA